VAIGTMLSDEANQSLLYPGFQPLTFWHGTFPALFFPSQAKLWWQV